MSVDISFFNLPFVQTATSGACVAVVLGVALKEKVNGKHWIEEWIVNKRNVDPPIAQISGKCFPQNAVEVQHQHLC